MLTFRKDVYTKIFYPYTPVVFLHAFPVNYKMWKPQMEYLQQKNRGFIAWDYPGFGKSKILEKEMNLTDYGEFIYQLLQDLGIHKGIFVGLSMGGYVALSLYRNHPNIFAGLMLANTKASADTAEGKQKRMTMVDSLKKSLDLSPVIDTHIEKFFTEETRQNNKNLVNQVEHLMQDSTVAGVIQAQKAMAERADSNELLPQMDFPVTVVSGDSDELISVSLAEEMANKIPNAKLEIIPGAAHLSNMEKPEKFNACLMELIERVQSDR